MVRLALRAATYLIANAVGLLLSVLILDGFTISLMAFLVAVLIFSIVQGISGPMIAKISLKSIPQLMGGISLVTIFFGLWITTLLVSGMEIGGIANWLAATLLVWLGSLVAEMLLPIFVFKQLRENKT
ncbi:phage holin family protein [Ruegeria atlantica]|nr:phage holin family protein [Ruegeria atlantica]